MCRYNDPIIQIISQPNQQIDITTKIDFNKSNMYQNGTPKSRHHDIHKSTK